MKNKSCAFQKKVNEGQLSLEELMHLLQGEPEGSLEANDRSICCAVKLGAEEEATEHVELFAEYLELTFQKMEELMGTPAVVVPTEISRQIKPSTECIHVVTQYIDGALRIMSDISAREDVFLAFATRYSGETLESVDELAIDCVKEFLNVVNGLYCIELAKKDICTELLPPGYAVHEEAPRRYALRRRIATSFGVFLIGLSIEVSAEAV